MDQLAYHCFYNNDSPYSYSMPHAMKYLATIAFKTLWCWDGTNGYCKEVQCSYCFPTIIMYKINNNY